MNLVTRGMGQNANLVTRGFGVSAIIGIIGSYFVSAIVSIREYTKLRITSRKL